MQAVGASVEKLAFPRNDTPCGKKRKAFPTGNAHGAPRRGGGHGPADRPDKGRKDGSRRRQLTGGTRPARPMRTREGKESPPTDTGGLRSSLPCFRGQGAR